MTRDPSSRSPGSSRGPQAPQGEDQSELLECLRRVGASLLDEAQPTEPEQLVATLAEALGGASVALWEQSDATRMLASTEPQDPSPAVGTVEQALDPGGRLRLKVGASSVSQLDQASRLLRALAPWLALALRRPEPPGLDPLLERLVARWGLRPVHQRVLRGIVRGQSNKEMAAEIGCHIKTIEAHVTAVLRRSGFDSAKELLSFLLASSDSKEPPS